jgi:hypothetical protein
VVVDACGPFHEPCFNLTYASSGDCTYTARTYNSEAPTDRHHSLNAKIAITILPDPFERTTVPLLVLVLKTSGGKSSCLFLSVPTVIPAKK